MVCSVAKTIIHIHQARIRKGLPAIIVRTWKGVTYSREVEFGNGAKLLQPEKPLACGARVWIESEGEVRIVDGGWNTSDEKL